MADDAEHFRTDEERKVFFWRRDRLIDAGYSLSVAETIAEDWNLDLRLAEKALGCGDEMRALYLLSVVGDDYNG